MPDNITRRSAEFFIMISVVFSEAKVIKNDNIKESGAKL
jgi:hypothetical protein